LQGLQKISISNDKIMGLPDTICQLKNVSVLYIAQNKLDCLPHRYWQFKKPKTPMVQKNRSIANAILLIKGLGVR